jgi:hypothetical protein
MIVVDTNEVWYKRKVPQGRNMDATFPRPMLNSPAESGVAAGNAFFASVVRRAQESRERRILLNEVLYQMYKQEPLAELDALLKKLEKMRPPFGK